jgi:MarR family multiple antibiotic resistance transcriptional regulator
MAANPKTLPQRRVAAPKPYYNAETYAADDSVGYLIGALRTSILRAVDLGLRKHGFTAAQWPILRAVADGETPIAADLCRRLNYDTGSMTRMLNRLEEKGVIVREGDRDDRRVVRLRMTATGRRIYPRLRDATIEVLNRLVDGFEAEEVQEVHRQLRRMYSNMEYAE